MERLSGENLVVCLRPLNQQGGQVAQEVMEALAAGVGQANELANRREPNVRKWLEKILAVNQQLQDKNL